MGTHVGRMRATACHCDDILEFEEVSSRRPRTNAEFGSLVAADRPRLRALRHHSLRRTKATLIYKRTGNLRAVQLLLGYTKIESTVRYLGIEMNDALEIFEQTDV